MQKTLTVQSAPCAEEEGSECRSQCFFVVGLFFEVHFDLSTGDTFSTATLTSPRRLFPHSSQRLRRGIVIIGSAFLVAVIYDMATGSKLGAEWLIPPSGPMAPENPDEARAATESLAKLPTTPAAAAEAAAKAAAAAAQSKSA